MKIVNQQGEWAQRVGKGGTAERRNRALPRTASRTAGPFCRIASRSAGLTGRPTEGRTRSLVTHPAGWETRDTADWEVCGTPETGREPATVNFNCVEFHGRARHRAHSTAFPVSYQIQSLGNSTTLKPIRYAPILPSPISPG